ncbi:MAG TPA: 2,3-bisphosphoglycerate-independent phosphoglycerate mutase [Micromonosporaceae bacterium]
MSNRFQRRRPVALIVLDGWGYRAERDGNAIELGHTPVWHGLWASQPHTLLDASGLAVGLPEGQMGNSEVGHLNLGAGRVVPQDLVRINQSIASGRFYDLEPLVALCKHLKETGATLHLAGLLGFGGVHALDKHLLAAVEAGRRHGVKRIAIHGFLDGRDSPPKSGMEVVRELVGQTVRRSDGQTVLATLTGRYFAMDRDKRWERTKLAYDAMVHGHAAVTEEDPVAAVAHAYERGETDEFIKPIVLTESGRPVATIRDGDGIFYFNFRSDRMRQIVRAISIPGFAEFDCGPRPATRAVTMTQYDQTFALPQAFPPFSMDLILAQVLADRDLSQYRTAETEKYPHVTYFFNGGVETPYKCEDRFLVPSPKVATYDLMPEMSAAGITDSICGAIEKAEHDFLLCNYANADMVGHTGVMPAVIKAVETVDQALARVVASAEKSGTRLLITADHGNCELMIDPQTGGPHTAHTTNPVPLVAIGTDMTTLRTGGALCDVAPTILELLGLEQPGAMTGRSLAERD